MPLRSRRQRRVRLWNPAAFTRVDGTGVADDASFGGVKRGSSTPSPLPTTAPRRNAPPGHHARARTPWLAPPAAVAPPYPPAAAPPRSPPLPPPYDPLLAASMHALPYWSRVRLSRLVVKGGNPYTTRGFIANTRGVIATCLVARTVTDEPSAALVAVSYNGIDQSPEACGRVGTSTSYTSSSSRRRPAACRLTPPRPPSPPPPIANASRGGSAPACVGGARRRAAGRRPRRRRRTARETPSSSASSIVSPPQKSATGCRAAPRAGG